MITKYSRGDGLERLPVMGWREVLERYSRPMKGGEDPGRVLMEQDEFMHLVRSVANVKLDRRALRAYASRRLGLLEPSVHVQGKSCYVFPHDFDRMGVVLILRQHYHLSLDAIRNLLARYPRRNYNLIINRRLAVEDLLDLAQMLSGGYGVNHVVMGKASDALLLDLDIPEGAARGDLHGVLEAQGKLLLGRLDEMKRWVSSGGWQDYVKNQTKEDIDTIRARHKTITKARTNGRARKAAR